MTKPPDDSNASTPATFHAPAERSPLTRIQTQSSAITAIPRLHEFLNATSDFVIILNQHRQIIYATENLGALIRESNPVKALGMRLGEALGCVNIADCPTGCGTTRACKLCGAVEAILSGLDGVGKVTECHLTRLNGKRREPLDFRVKSTPLSHDGQVYTVLALTDISHEKRRKHLENVFLHDLIRDAITLDIHVSKLRQEVTTKNSPASMGAVSGQISRMIERILFQHDLAEAENNALSASFIRLEPYRILRGLLDEHQAQAAETGSRIELDPFSSSQLFFSDRVLLQRVLATLMSNALEASRAGETVTIGAEHDPQQISFWIRNTAVIPEAVRLQIFSRSFSTKSPSRGLGTYTARLLTEQYLKGKIRFTSEKDTGTTFYVDIPLACQIEDDDEGEEVSPSDAA